MAMSTAGSTLPPSAHAHDSSPASAPPRAARRRECLRSGRSRCTRQASRDSHGSIRHWCSFRLRRPHAAPTTRRCVLASSSCSSRSISLASRLAFSRGQHAAGILVELGAQLRRGHRVLRRAEIMFLRLLDHAAVVQRDANRALEAAGAREVRIDVVAHAPRQRRGSPGCRRFSVAYAVFPSFPSCSASAIVYCRLIRACESDAGASFSATGSQTIDTLNSATGHSMCAHVGGRDAVRLARAQHGIHVRMQHVRRGIRLERGVAALPRHAQTGGHAFEILFRSPGPADVTRTGRTGLRASSADRSRPRAPASRR